MITPNQELVKYRIFRSKETYEEALLLAKNGYWNAVANRLYYSCFYIVNALLTQNDLNFSSHNGVKTQFHKHFVKPGVISQESGRTYSRLFNLRQEGDYVDFKRLKEKDVKPFIGEVVRLHKEIQYYLP